MSATATLPEHRPDFRDPDEVPQPERLDFLRREAARSRAASDLDLFEACRLLTIDREKAPRVFAQALFRTLRQALGRRPVIYRTGSSEISFDERWLLRLIERLECGDTDSFTFLVSRRIPRHYRRSLAFLVHGLVPQPQKLCGASRSGPDGRPEHYPVPA